MILMPYKQYLLISDLQPPELRARITTVLERPWERSRVPLSHRYRGVVDESGFRIRKRIRRQNAYQPTIVCAFHPSDSGTILQLAILVDEWLLLSLASTAVLLGTLALTDEGWAMAVMVLGVFMMLHLVLYLIGYLPARATAIKDMWRLCDVRSEWRHN